MTLQQLQQLVMLNGILLRRLDYLMRKVPSQELVATIRSVEQCDKVARNLLHNHPDYSYEGL